MSAWLSPPSVTQMVNSSPNLVILILAPTLTTRLHAHGRLRWADHAWLLRLESGDPQLQCPLRAWRAEGESAVCDTECGASMGSRLCVVDDAMIPIYDIVSACIMQFSGQRHHLRTTTNCWWSAASRFRQRRPIPILPRYGI